MVHRSYPRAIGLDRKGDFSDRSVFEPTVRARSEGINGNRSVPRTRRVSAHR
jgi:hypothetical protein